jgi:phage-related protein
MVAIDVQYIHNNIQKFIDDLDHDTSAHVMHALFELSRYGNELTTPLSKPIGHKLFELRILKPMHVRIIYVFHNNQAWVLHIFKKKTDKIPLRDIELAKQRYKLLFD